MIKKTPKPTASKTATPKIASPQVEIKLSKEKSEAEKLVRQVQGTLQRVGFAINGKDTCKSTMHHMDSAIGMLLKARKYIFLNHANECLEDEMKDNKKKALKDLEVLYDRDW